MAIVGPGKHYCHRKSWKMTKSEKVNENVVSVGGVDHGKFNQSGAS